MTDYSFLEGKKVLITGASGLIGRALVSALLLHEWENPVKVVALVRNEEKARKCFASLPSENLEYIVCDVCDLQPMDMGVDYIIHGASFTSSKSFIEQPVDVINTSIKGTEALLSFARANKIKSFVYISSMEVYGAPLTDDKIYEDALIGVNPMSVRSSYPESKRLCECLCAAYYSQYGVPAKSVRLTLTFGEEVSYSDGRVFAEFLKCVIEGRDIVLKTKGETKRNYLYTGDAVSAILTVLNKGVNGEAYNAANEDTYCSIYELAHMIADKFGGGKTKVIIDTTDAESRGFAPTLKVNLSTDKLKSLGWKPETDLFTALDKTFKSLVENRKNFNR